MSPRRAPREMHVAPELRAGVQPGPAQPRYALLINPFYPKDPHTSFGKHVLTPSLALTSIAAATPPHWQVRYWDENLLQGPPPWKPFPEVVGITVHLTFAQRAYALARWYRRRGAKVILGGLHVTSCPQEAMPHADAVAIGEGVQLWPQILADVEAGQLKAVYRGNYAQPYRREPPPRRELLPRKSFLTTAGLIATRGCHNRCGFCYLATRGLHMPYMTRDVEQVVEELRSVGQPYAVFMDNNLGSDAEYLRRLCRALRPLELIWSAAVSIDVTDDPSLVREMALAGCTGVFVGFETLDTRNIRDARKRSPPAEDYARRTAVFHDHGVHVNGSFVLGFDHDGPEVFERTVAWIEANRLECATFHILTPYPGTPLFRADGGPRAALAQELEPLRHGPRGVSPAALDAGATGRGLCLVLPPLVFARLDLAASAGKFPGRAGLPGDGLSLQACQSDVAVPDPPPPHGRAVAADAGLVAAGALEFSPPPPRPAAGTSPFRRKKSSSRGF